MRILGAHASFNVSLVSPVEEVVHALFHGGLAECHSVAGWASLGATVPTSAHPVMPCPPAALAVVAHELHLNSKPARARQPLHKEQWQEGTYCPLHRSWPRGPCRSKKLSHINAGACAQAWGHSSWYHGAMPSRLPHGTLQSIAHPHQFHT